jgi:hypothetical protein
MSLNDRVALVLGQLQLQILQLQEVVDTLQKQLEEKSDQDTESELP